MILHSGWQAANKKGTSKAFSNAIAAQYKAQFGREMRNLKLDNSGFHP
ncbi:hypothetical protein [Mucilaginibacter phyllosphaerae]|uniref:Uncharacterized protein n=1 Tax=Mucilaginibacter phyllosphaerae TaxID=1812349 RepID=A0ABR6I399_9SPHI|nr:hypothetical protein [Mucilaginibacter phyllosphaerae]MBB3967511.1 hypothetical protein [Mucilaginibacter phyllosphaerae]